MINQYTIQAFVASIMWLLMVNNTKTAVMPPPWADPLKNQCAEKSKGGWQWLYWPPDDRCYKIYQIGYPCSETMELSPVIKDGSVVAVCQCPPGTVQSLRDNRCHSIFTRASCPQGQYFAPVTEIESTNSGQQRWGVCREPGTCLKHGQLYWPRDGQCYNEFTRGPCRKGQLLTLDEKDGLAVCSCSSTGKLEAYYWSQSNDEGCYEHYLTGPCSEPGKIYLPGGSCGCNKDLPQYHMETKQCYTLGDIGPCPRGHHFVINATLSEDQEIHAKCLCKPGYILFSDGLCYRVYTRGPCGYGKMLINSTDCLAVPYQHGRLYFSQEKTWYKVGTKGPCQNGQVVTYDRSVKLSIDGISYNGVCECTKESKLRENCTEAVNDSCENIPGMIVFDKMCYKLYTQGPCGHGEWLITKRQPRNQQFSWRINHELSTKSIAQCDCRPGYKRISHHSEVSDVETNTLSALSVCQPPSFNIVQFLNHHHSKSTFFHNPM